MIRIIPNTDGKYAVGTDGNVYRIKNKELFPLAIDSSSGSARVIIGGKHVCVHKLVATEFVQKNYPGENCVCHLNGDKFDNRAENLKWMTMSQASLYSRSLKR